MVNPSLGGSHFGGTASFVYGTLCDFAMCWGTIKVKREVVCVLN
jgi:hypothetical protein